jgi:hypothetical protein
MINQIFMNLTEHKQIGKTLSLKYSFFLISFHSTPYIIVFICKYTI